MDINCDLHLHTALSPCALEEMSPNNLVNMALICGLDAIAVTDHNSCENAEAVMKVAEGTDLVVLPGLEVETVEEIHMVCLFETIEQAIDLQKEVYSKLPLRPNNPRIFGDQLLMDTEDEPIGKVDKLLSFSTAISIDVLVPMVRDMMGVCIPAHIDRPSYSVLSNLGTLPEHLYLPVLEISRFAHIKEYQDMYPNHLIIQASDAHELGYIGTGAFVLAVEEKSAAAIIKALRQN